MILTVGFTWRVPPEEAFPELSDAYIRAIQRGVEAIAQRWAPEIENYMKSNASWVDRTGNARQGLHTEVDSVARSMVRIILAHGVEYGLWLEIRNQGRYAIVNPALDYFAPRIWGDVVRMLS